MSMMMTHALEASPIGPILIAADARHIHRIQILEPSQTVAENSAVSSPIIAAARDQLRAYFARDLDVFDLPLAPALSPRGAALRDAIIAIPAGKTLSYGALARLAGSSARAIGQACARNPFPIVVPCHRILGSGGALGHYSAGGGVATKRWLLDHERRGGLL